MKTALRQILLAKKNLWTASAITAQLWLDGADVSTLTNVSGGYSQWNDKSGNNAHVTKASSPFPQSTTINGKNAVRFNGNTFLQNTVKQFPLQTRSVYIVFRENTSIPNQGFFTINPTTGNDYDRSDAIVYCPSNKSSSYFIIIGGTNVSYILQYADNPSQASPLAIYQETKNSSIGKAYFNATQVASSSSFSEFSLLSGGGYLLGARYLGGAIASSGSLLNGDICEIIYLDFVPPVADDQRMQGYLAHKWGLTANLPSDHPYKTTPPYL